MSKDHEEKDRPLVLLLDQDQALWQPADGAAGLSSCDLVEVREAAEVFHGFTERPPEFVILGATGLEADRFTLCAKLRELPGGSTATLLVMTSPGDVPAMERAFEAGADGIIPTSIDWNTLDRQLRFLWRQVCSRRALQRREARLRRFLLALPDTLLRLGPEGRILDVHGPEGSELARFLRASVGRRIGELVAPGAAHADARAFQCALGAGSKRTIAHPLRLEGRTIACETTLAPAGSGEMIAIVREAREQKKCAGSALRRSTEDESRTGLQGLPAFRGLLAGSLAQARRAGRSLALLLVDLNRLLPVSETFGTVAGDSVLKTACERIVHCTRQGDRRAGFRRGDAPPSLARLGGDQLAVLLEPIGEAQDSARVARRILDTLSQPFLVADREVDLTANIGIAVFPGDGDDADTLLLSAHKAMLDARQRGESTFEFLDPSRSAIALRRWGLEGSMGNALSAEELSMVYQPRVDLRTGRITGVEVLPFWDHPEWGVIPPPEIIELSGRTGLITLMGEWMIRSACLQSRIWGQAGLPAIRMAVSLPARQLRSRNLVEVVERALATSSLDPSLLELTITGGAAMGRSDAMLRILNDLNGLGVKIVLGALGSGSASLRSLTRLPLHGLKIDGALIKDLHARPESQALVKAILAVAGSLGLYVIADGVRAHEELRLLKESGCSAMQGDYFSPPLPALDMTRLLEQARQLVC